MNIILLGPPGSGKGTQGARLADRMGIVRVATGDLLRAAVGAGTPLGRRAQNYMEQGLLVPDDVILGLIGEVLATPEARDGIIMDGFPRTILQAQAVDGLLSSRGQTVDHVLTFAVPEEELISRMLGRAADQGRKDDTPEAIRRRLAVYREQTEPLIAFYEERDVLAEVLGTGSVEEVANRVDQALKA
jgi:adenylate kinase